MRKNILLIAGIIFLMFLFWGCTNCQGNVNPDPPPGDVTNLSVSVNSSQVTLTWTNPADIDFSYCEVWYGKGSGTDTLFPGTTSAAGTIITGLTNGESYSFKVIAVDLTGSKSNGVVITTVIPLFEIKLTASDGAEGDWFGISVGISSDGSIFIVGAYEDDDNGAESGSVYIYKWSGSVWVETKLTASDGAAGDYYGSSVSISSDGTTVLVGAFLGDGIVANSGSVYVYKWNGSTWAETKLTASDGVAGDYFGNSICISSDGTTVLVGTHSDDNGLDSGSVYIYKWNGSTWAETKLTASDGAAEDYFGNSVGISSDGTTFFASAYLDDDNGTNSGSVYIYRWNGSTWAETKLTASDGAASDNFGNSGGISSDGNAVLAGAFYDDTASGTDSGSAYIYKWNGSVWTETKLTASDGTLNDWFGSAVSLSSDGTTLLVGASRRDTASGLDFGSAYVYKWNGSTWVETKLTASDGDTYDYYGNAVDISSDGTTILVGADSDNTANGVDAGSVYIYK